MRTGKKRPPLTRHILLADFAGFYWYKEELARFCGKHGIQQTGQKLDLYNRIYHFLDTGFISKKIAATKKQVTAKSLPELTIKSVVDHHYRCNNITRQFFQSVIGPHFHFTAHLQAYLKANREKGLTYGDLVKEWAAEYERRKDKRYKAPIHASWEYNQFTRDYLSDVQNQNRSISASAEAWKKIRLNNGPRTYQEYKKLFKT
jgi:SAP domain-containing protein/uncharacterized protein DUF6434